MKTLKKILFISVIAVASLSGCKKEQPKEDFKYLGQIAPFLHEVVYDEYEFDVNCLTVKNYLPSCSAVRNGNFIGRNFDDYVGVGHVILGYPNNYQVPPKVIKEGRVFYK